MENVSIKLQRLKDACIERSERLEVANEQLNQELSECELIKSQIPTDLLIARNNLEEATLKMKFEESEENIVKQKAINNELETKITASNARYDTEKESMISIISTLLDEEFLLMQTHVQLYDRVNVTCEAPQMTEEDIRAHLLREEQRVRGLSSSGRLLTKRKLLQDLQMERNDLDKQLRTMEQNL